MVQQPFLPVVPVVFQSRKYKVLPLLVVLLFTITITVSFLTEPRIQAVRAFTLQSTAQNGYGYNNYRHCHSRPGKLQRLHQSERVDDLDIPSATDTAGTATVEECIVNNTDYFMNDDDDDDQHHASVDDTCDTSSTTVMVRHDTNFANVGVGQALQRLGVVGELGTSTATTMASKPTVWTEFSRIAQECTQQRNQTIVNLGQGFPDWLPPPFAIESLVEAALEGSGSSSSSSSTAKSPNNLGVGSIHQYTRPAGHPNLVQQLARRYSLHMNRPIDAMKEVAVTVGASQALYLTLQVMIQPGDEVILFEPFFDLYLNQIRLAGGTPVFVPLEFQPYEIDHFTGGDWVLNRETLHQKVSPKAKAIILNSPHNPTGKVFTRTEMEYIAESLELANPDCVVLSDEVYKYIVHSSPPSNDRGKDESLFCRGHIHFASLPGMWDRTITISSAGKTFSATGWQIGWCVGPSRIIGRIHQLLPYVQFCASTVMQEALARSLRRADEPYEGYDSYYDWLRAVYTQKRDVLANALTKAGFAVPDFHRSPGGGFFLFARVGEKIAQLVPSNRLLKPNSATPTGLVRADWALCQWMAEEIGLLCIPSGPFFSPESASTGEYSDHFVRIAFCKTDETIEAAATTLSSLQSKFISAESKHGCTADEVEHVPSK